MKENLKQLGVKVDRALLRRLDLAAKKGGRTRSSEARMRLEQSFKEKQPAVQS